MALLQGKQQDNAWIAHYAGACFSGSALRWYERLDEDVQDDWRKLRSAMLERWPEHGMDDDLGAETSFAAMVPTPPAAAPPPSPRPVTNSDPGALSRALGNMSLSTKRGLIRLDAAGDGKSYVYQTRNSSGSFGTTSRREHALIVEYDVGPPPHRIRVQNVENCSWLAVKWNSMVAIGAGATK
ncbi:hypothetical protein FRC01_005733 [Tulasnella sp. 417]|nr:hypothetical protein FRC01_005733 [Tulasnella sp. 417]